MATVNAKAIKVIFTFLFGTTKDAQVNVAITKTKYFVSIYFL